MPIDPIDETNDESFPASDPPAWTTTHAGAPIGLRQRAEIQESIDPEFFRVADALRSRAYAAGALDPKTVELIAFAILIARGHDSARAHAAAALRSGATLDQLEQTIALATTVAGGILAFDEGNRIIAELRRSA